MTSFAPITPVAAAVREGVRWDAFDGMSHIVGFNYQPGWGHDARSIWLDGFDADEYRRELENGKRYFPGFNCVRIWLGYGAYRVDPETLLANFHRAIDIATELELLVIPVLFSVWAGVPPFDPIALDDLVDSDFEADFGEFLARVAEPHRGNPSILAWDICNEPNEGEPIAPGLAAQARWMRWVRDKVTAIDPESHTMVGTVADFNWGGEVLELVDAITPHLYGYPLWKQSELDGRTTTEFRTWFGAIVDHYVGVARIFSEPKPILSTETCWGSSSDEVRVGIIADTLAVLRGAGIGYLAHALQTSGVSDLHPLADGERPADFSAFPDPSSMAFVLPDGSLRPGHEVFNEFAR